MTDCSRCAAAPLEAASCGCSATRRCRRDGSSSESATCTATGASATFEARSDNPRRAGAVDSHEFGWVPAAGSYRVVWTIRGRDSRDRVMRVRLRTGPNLRILN